MASRHLPLLSEAGLQAPACGSVSLACFAVFAVVDGGSSLTDAGVLVASLLLSPLLLPRTSGCRRPSLPPLQDAGVHCGKHGVE